MLHLRRKDRPTVRPCLEQLERRDAPAVLTFAEAGGLFNDATRRLQGGLWQLPAGQVESNQPTGFVKRYAVTDLTAVRDNIIAERAPGGDLHNFGDVTQDHLDTIVADLNKAIALAPNTIPGSVNARANQTEIRTLHLQILNIVNHDDNLADLAAMVPAGANVGFMEVPPKLAVPLADAPHETFNQIGKIFNDAANRMIGGVGSAANEAAVKADIQVMISSLTELAQDFQGRAGIDQQLARIHILVIRDQLPHEIDFINQAANNTNPVAPKGSNDIFLDLIDIAQGDPVLKGMLTTGWAVYPDFSTPPTPYQDNVKGGDLNTVNFFAHMDADANNLGAEGVKDIIIGASPALRADLITRLQTFAAGVGAFVASKGGLFEARFDNELIAINSTTGSAITAMIDALNTNNLDEANAAAIQMHANVADVSGNNRWVSFDGDPNVNGGLLWHRYNASGTTPDNNPVTGVLNQPGTVMLIVP
jgi:hypothetical protein